MTLKYSHNESPVNGILFIGFNQNKECFGVGLKNGFRIYNLDPLKEYMRSEFEASEERGVGYVEMLYRTSFIGLLGGGVKPIIPSSRFSLWEGDVRKFILEMNFKSEIKAVKLKSDRIIIVFKNSINVYTFCEKPELIYSSETFENPMGIVAVSQSKTNPIIAYPGTTQGCVVIAHVVQNSSLKNSNPQDRPPPRCITAHENPLVALALNDGGTLLATASSRGTLIRIFDTKSCEIQFFLRRGSYLASITNICFNAGSNLICANSDHCTIHIFDLKKSIEGDRKDSDTTTGCGPGSITCLGNSPSSSSQVKHSKSIISSASNFLPKYFNSVKIITSCVRIHLDHSYKSICAFSPHESNTVIVLSANGSYTKYTFSLATGNFNRLINVNFLDYKDDLDI